MEWITLSWLLKMFIDPFCLQEMSYEEYQRLQREYPMKDIN